MALPLFIGGKKEEEVFVSFVVGKNWIQAGVWNVQENKGALIAAGTTSPWQEGPTPPVGTESFVEAADDSLSSAIGALEEEPKLEHVVFGLPTLWIESGKVKEDKLGLLKKLCDTLELKPSGFVVIPESLVFTLKQKEEGASVSFILVGFVEDEIEITLVRDGKIVDTNFVSRSISLGDDVSEGLARFGTDNLPPRIILYNRHINELNEIKSELSGWEWPSSFFLHTPRIETLPPDAVITAVSEAGAVEVTHVTKFTESTVIDVQEKPRTAEGEKETVPEVQTDLDLPPEPIEEKTHEPSPRILFPRLTNPLNFLPSLGGARGRGFLIFLPALLLLIAGTLFFLPRAQATIHLSPQKLEDSFDVVVSSTGEENGKLSGRVVSGELTGEKTKSTSGRKTVGERAKGEVVILNNTSSPRSFAAGTALAGPNGLKFILDSTVTVASESGAPNYKPGETKGQATAGDIGAEYNLAPGNIFSLANFQTSSFSARVDTPLTGGSAREVASVEKEDQEKLEQELKAELEERALSQLQPQLGTSEILIRQSTKTSVASRSFSAKPGDETETLNLRLTVRVDTTVITKEQLENYIRNVLTNKIPQAFVLQSGHIQVTFTPKEEQKTSDQEFTLHVTALLLPDINKKELAGKISGKTLEGAQRIFSNLPGFVRSTVKLSPPLPGPLYRLPIKSDNITLEILPER